MRSLAPALVAIAFLSLAVGCNDGVMCFAAIDCVETCGGPIVASGCSCPSGTIDVATCEDADAGPMALLDTIELVSVTGDGSDTSGSEELCVTLRSDPEVIVDQVVFLTATFTGPIRITPEGVTLCQTGCWCFAPSGNEVQIRRGREVRYIPGPSGACCG